MTDPTNMEIDTAALNAVGNELASNPAMPTRHGILKTAYSDLKVLNSRINGAIEALDQHIDTMFGPTPTPVGELPQQPVAKSFMDAVTQEIVQAHNLIGLIENRIKVLDKTVNG